MFVHPCAALGGAVVGGFVGWIQAAAFHEFVSFVTRPPRDDALTVVLAPGVRAQPEDRQWLLTLEPVDLARVVQFSLSHDPSIGGAQCRSATHRAPSPGQWRTGHTARWRWTCTNRSRA